MRLSPFLLDLHLLLKQLTVIGEWSFLDSQCTQFFKYGLQTLVPTYCFLLLSQHAWHQGLSQVM